MLPQVWLQKQGYIVLLQSLKQSLSHLCPLHDPFSGHTQGHILDSMSGLRYGGFDVKLMSTLLA